MNITCGDLMTKPSTPTVDHNAHLACKVDAHLLGGEFVVYFIHYLDLSVVVTRP